MSVDVDMYGEVNRAMHEVLNHFVKATRDRKEAARQATESPSPVATTQPALIAPSEAGPSNSFGHTVAPPLAPSLHHGPRMQAAYPTMDWMAGLFPQLLFGASLASLGFPSPMGHGSRAPTPSGASERSLATPPNTT
ncbi:hypothetical protein SK128_021663, partial [Halocaridina rubra]